MPVDVNYGDWTEKELEELLEHGVPEGQHVEYKLAFPGRSDGERKEFLADVSAFANSNGGAIFFGIEAIDGVPTAICGLDLSAAEPAKLDLESRVRDGLAPRILGFLVHTLALSSGRWVLLAEIPKSRNGPHMITFQDHGRFYRRSSASKHIMDVAELREAFLLGAAMRDRMREWISGRISLISAGQGPVELVSSAMIAIHLVPECGLDGFSRVSIPGALRNQVVAESFFPIENNKTRNRGRTPTHDGLLYFQVTEKNWLPDHLKADATKATGYSLCFRDACIEAVDAILLGECPYWVVPKVEFAVLGFVLRMKRVLASLQVPPPFYCKTTLIGVKGIKIHDEGRGYLTGQNPFEMDRAQLELPEVELAESLDSIPEELKPALDVLWNSFGIERCLLYDESGNFGPKDWVRR